MIIKFLIIVTLITLNTLFFFIIMNSNIITVFFQFFIYTILVSGLIYWYSDYFGIFVILIYVTSIPILFILYILLTNKQLDWTFKKSTVIVVNKLLFFMLIGFIFFIWFHLFKDLEIFHSSIFTKEDFSTYHYNKMKSSIFYYYSDNSVLLTILDLSNCLFIQFSEIVLLIALFLISLVLIIYQTLKKKCYY